MNIIHLKYLGSSDFNVPSSYSLFFQPARSYALGSAAALPVTAAKRSPDANGMSLSITNNMDVLRTKLGRRLELEDERASKIARQLMELESFSP